MKLGQLTRILKRSLRGSFNTEYSLWKQTYKDEDDPEKKRIYAMFLEAFNDLADDVIELSIDNFLDLVDLDGNITETNDRKGIHKKLNNIDKFNNDDYWAEDEFDFSEKKITERVQQKVEPTPPKPEPKPKPEPEPAPEPVHAQAPSQPPARRRRRSRKEETLKIKTGGNRAGMNIVVDDDDDDDERRWEDGPTNDEINRAINESNMPYYEKPIPQRNCK